MKNKILLFALAAALFAACGKDGEPGPAGTNGTNGINGTVNIVTKLDTVLAGKWAYTTPDQYIVIKNNAAITDANKDVVLMYYSSSPSGVWEALPGFNLPRHGENLGFEVQNGKVLIIWDALSAPPYAFYFKTVVIPH